MIHQILLNSFIEAAAEVLKAECQLSVRTGKLSLEKSALATDDVTVLISMVGQIEGVVLFGLSNQTGLNLVSRVFGQSFATFDSLVESGIAELSNVISGRAGVKLAKAGYDTTISVPSLLHGKGSSISILDNARVVVPLESEAGLLTIHLALKEWAKPGN